MLDGAARAERLVPTVVLPADAAAPRSAEGTPPRPHGGRRDIQGLRAVAVALVVAYHLRPGLLPGGFVGVDVFLVISGFLIVGSLGREAAATGRISLRGFYARRIRRLLPASTVVLLATTAATLLLMPVSRWLTTAQGVVASALEVQNWALAAGTGYAAATGAVSPVQHYWSLAVEEQFYVVAPLLLLLVVRFADRRGWSRRRAVAVLVAALSAASLAHSVLFSASSHDVAYFATTTRMWELGLGGLVALVGPRLRLGRAIRELCAWAGLGAIGVAAVFLTTDMAFPGWVALVPVLGSGLVLLAGTPGVDRAVQAGVAGRLLGARPLTYVGDISYSLYLWHWPVIVFFVFLAEHSPDPLECAALAVGSLVLAALSTRVVERPFRISDRRAGRHAAAASPGAAFRLATALLAASLVAGIGPWILVHQRQAALPSVALGNGHPGGAGVLPDRLPVARTVVPDPAVATSDGPIVYTYGCGQYDPRKDAAEGCVFGDKGADVRVALVGDSHAIQYSSALADIAGRRHWELHTLVRDGCPFTAAPIQIKGVPYHDCADANRLTLENLVSLHPRVVVVSALQPGGYDALFSGTWSSERDLVEGYRTLWTPLTAAGITVLVIRDAPTPDYVDPECVERHGPAAPACGMTRTEGVTRQPDPEVEAARGMPGVSVLDLTDHFCNRTVCPGVVGGVLVYRDNHLTNTFSLSLRPVVENALSGLVAAH